VITYVDTSALIKLLVEEEGSERAALIWNAADVLASVSVLAVEARAVLAEAERAGLLRAVQHRRAKAGLADLLDDLTIVEATEDLINWAGTLAEEEALRGQDALHLAAALTIEATVLASANPALLEAAERHGMHTADPSGPLDAE
jgi:predicted nucleic acid-binding protein